MPELPDVETFKRYLTSTALHQRIESVTRIDERILADVSPRTLRRHLVGAELIAARRHGKYLFAELDADRWLLLHFGMTGYLRYYKSEPPAELQHVRTQLDFAGGYHLAYSCQRLFGAVGLVRDPDQAIADKELGPDALTIGAAEFTERLRAKHGSLKSALMDQSTVAGLGNVYTDEVFFRARLDPRLAVSELDSDQLGTLYRAMRHVLSRAIDAQADPEKMPASWLTPVRGGGRCPRCGGEIERLDLAGRRAWWCPGCQSA